MLAILAASVSAARAQNRIAPVLIDAPDPTYPLDRQDAGEEPIVIVHATVETDGRVSEAHVEEPHDTVFDDAAVATAREWRFTPAQRDGTPMRARVRLSVHFHLPLEQPTLPPVAAPPDLPPDADEPVAHEEEVPEFGAEGRVDPLAQAAQPRASSQYELPSDLIAAAPHRDAGDLLSSAPGVYVARGEGDGVAHSIFLRGFDAEHGQDLELTMDGVPLNQPSHLHGQGYADLGFVIPEVVQSIGVTEGVYDPHQGDFATAGSIGFHLGVPERGFLSRTTYGSFDTFRQLVLWAPSGERDGTFGAATYRRTSGFGSQRGGESGSLIAQYEPGGDDHVRARVTAVLYGARYNLAGILRTDDVAAGRVGFYDAYADPTASAQSSFAVRALLSGTVDFLGDRGSFGEIGAWVGFSDFRLQANYTGYTQVSQIEPSWRGRGDLIEQRSTATSFGLRARWRSESFTIFDWLSGFFEAGASGRLDLQTQAQNLIDATNNQTWDRRVDASITGGDVGIYVDLDLHVTDRIRLRGGVRGDVLSYAIDDRLGNFTPSFRPTTFVPGFRRTALGLAVGPRASIEATPVDGLTFSVAYGEGYRSPQARTLSDGESAPYAKVRSGDIGMRLRLGDDDELELTISGYLTTLSNDVAFDPSQGRLEPIGPTTRLGGALYLIVRPLSWLLGAMSITYVRATLDGPPFATAMDPAPPYVAGQAIPYVPPLVVRIDARADEQVAVLADLPFRVRGAVGFSMLSRRPLPYGDDTDAFALLDLSAGVTWGPVDLGVDLFNVLDRRYQATGYSFASNWTPTATPSMVPAPSFAAGAPLTVLATLGLRIE